MIRKKIIGVIPARLESQRFPRKPLAKINGQEMIIWVCKAASKAKLLSKLIVATDSEEIENVVKQHGFHCEMTSKFCLSGSDRVCEVALKTDGDVYVNIQGDEPLIESNIIDEVIQPFLTNINTQIVTAISQVSNEEEYKNPNVVKVVIDKNNNALYFSRSPIPYFRNEQINFNNVYKHIGIYAYQRNVLIDFKNTPMSTYENIEKLEQLRLLENGYKIHCIKTNYVSKGVDTKEDLEEVEKIIKNQGVHK